MLKLQTREDLQRLIDEKEAESLRLEFKAGDAIGKDDKRKFDISKDVSAMANADGGQIVYGIKERQTTADRFWPVDGRQFNREWVENVIRHHIRPPIAGLHVEQVLIGPEENDVAYVIEVPPALALAPHQANDQRYYRRRNFEASPMEDYEVREAMRRQTAPKLRAFFDSWVEENWGTDGRIRRFTIEPNVVNESVQPAMFLVFQLFADQRLAPTASYAPGAFEPDNRYELKHPLGARTSCFIRRHMAPEGFPVFREASLRLNRVAWNVPNFDGEREFALSYRIASPGDEIAEHMVLKIDGLRRELTIL